MSAVWQATTQRFCWNPEVYYCGNPDCQRCLASTKSILPAKWRIAAWLVANGRFDEAAKVAALDGRDSAEDNGGVSDKL